MRNTSGLVRARQRFQARQQVAVKRDRQLFARLGLRVSERARAQVHVRPCHAAAIGKPRVGVVGQQDERFPFIGRGVHKNLHFRGCQLCFDMLFLLGFCDIVVAE